MVSDEKIKLLVKASVGQASVMLPDEVNAEAKECVASFMEESIKLGARMVLADLWHDASEEPDAKLDAWIIMQTGKDLFETVKYGGYNEDGGQTWQQQAKKGNILRWCYLSDLLPKKGGEK